MLFDLLKVLLLLVGAGMIIGGSLTGLCGVIAGEGGLFILGFLLLAVGLAMFIAINNSFKRQRRLAQVAAEATGRIDGVPRPPEAP